MLRKLSIKNFTAFSQANLNFSTGLNVIIGENGTGKTHLLKLAYLFSNAGHSLVVEDNKIISEQKVERYFSQHLKAIYKPDKVGSLTKTNGGGKTQVSAISKLSHLSNKTRERVITMDFGDALKEGEVKWQFTFSNRAKDNIIQEKTQERLTGKILNNTSVFLPSKEMISFFDGFLALYEKHEMPFDETYRDLALHLSTPKLKSVPDILQHALLDLTDDIGGSLKLEGGRFYLICKGEKPKEITLVAEGIRKLATLMHLIENGSLEQGNTLFWDEPESNLNPKLIKDVAAAILFLCSHGIQVVLATHSLFLLRELEILSSQNRYKKVPQCYFSLDKKSEDVIIHQGNSIDEIDPVVMLDESLMQSDRFMEQG